jgi:hypothetical protein
VRRTVATLLVLASPLLVAAPVGAAPDRLAGPVVVPAAPAVEAVVPAAPVTVAPPALPVVATPVIAAPAPSSVRPVRAVRAAAHRARALDDAAYAARLQADLCLARQIFCGLDRSGRYLAH